MTDAPETAIQRWERERAERDEFCRGSQWTEGQLAAIRATKEPTTLAGLLGLGMRRWLAEVKRLFRP